MSKRSRVKFSNACVLLGGKIYPEGGQIIIMTLCTVPQFASEDAAMSRNRRNLNNHIRYYRETRTTAIAELNT